MTDVLAFAGERGSETPVLEPEALQLLSRYDDRATHCETATFSPGSQPGRRSIACQRAATTGARVECRFCDSVDRWDGGLRRGPRRAHVHALG